MNVVLLGIQGAGKGSVLIGLESYFDFTLVSVGQLLRNEVNTGSELGKHIHELLTKGMLVETDIIEKILRQKLKHRQNFTIFDGFPRNLEQAEILEKILKIDLVIHLKLTKDQAVKRILNRLTCSRCGFVTQTGIYESGICPVCGGNLETRSDDTLPAINKRIDTFERETLPLVRFYEDKCKVVELDASKKLETVVMDVLKVINECNN